MSDYPQTLTPGDRITKTWLDQLMRAIRRQRPVAGPGLRSRITPDGTVLTADVGTRHAAAPAAPLAPFAVRFHVTEGDPAGQWEVYLPPGCCNVGGPCDPINTPASKKGGHNDDVDWYALAGLSALYAASRSFEDEDGYTHNEKTQKASLYVHVKPSAKVSGVDAIDAPARRLFAVLSVDDGMVETLGLTPDVLYAIRSQEAGDVFSAPVARVTITEDTVNQETNTSRSIAQIRKTAIDLVPPAGTGVSGFDLVWVFRLIPLTGLLYTDNLYCVRQTSSAAGITISGATVTDVAPHARPNEAHSVYARIDVTDLTSGDGVVQVLLDPEGTNVSTPYVVFLQLYALQYSCVIADHRSQSLVNLQLYHA